MGPEELNRRSQPVVEIYMQIEQDMLERIARLLRNTQGELEHDPALWQLRRLEQMGILEDENLEVIRRKAGMAPEELNKVLLSAGLDSIKDNDEELERALQKGANIIQPEPVEQSQGLMDILSNYEAQAQNAFNLTNQILVDQANEVYRQIINQAVAEVITGNITGEKAVRRIVSRKSEQGIPAFVRSDGAEVSPEGYIRSVVKSTTNNVTNEMQEERMKQWGVKLTEISSHAGNRPGCRPYAGRIFSLEPGNPKYPYLYDPVVGRIGDPDSLFGVNCGHFKYPFIEGISTKRYEKPSSTEDKRVYEESQQQRAIERSIRKAKTRKKMMEAIGDKEGVNQANELIRARQARMRRFIKDTNRTRRSYREQLYG